MPRMTKAQAKKRLNEARAKIMAVYVANHGFGFGADTHAVSTQAVELI